MSQAMDYVEYLSREIGARTPGSEEEELAALYIADEIQKETGFSATIEEFQSSANLEGARAILSMITIVASVLAMLFSILTPVMFLLALISAIVYVLESYDKRVLSNKFPNPPSQNVVAKYIPGSQEEGERRGAPRRKIVLVAHYDTCKVTPGVVRAVEGMKLPLPRICLAAMVAAAFFLLLRIFVGGTGGVALIFLNILTIVSIILVALPIVQALLYRASQFSEGANNNATGVAALLEVARRISSGSVSEADLLAEEQDVVVHGEEAAYEEGLVPEGASIRYEAQANVEEEEELMSEEDRLLAAKAAIAALTGQAVEQRVYSNVSSEVPAPRAHADEPVAAAKPSYDEQPIQVEQEVAYAATPAYGAAASPAATAVEEGVDTGFENAPSWFVSAKRNAKRSETSQPIQKSRYTEAIEAAERDMAERERAREEEARALREQEIRAREEATRAALAAMREEKAAEPVAEPVVEVAADRPEQPAQVYAPVEVHASVEVKPAVEEPLVEEGLSPFEEFERLAAAFSAEQPAVEERAEAAVAAAEAEPAGAEEPVEQDAAEEAEDLSNEPAQDELDQEVPGEPADEAEPEVDLGQTIAYTPELLHQAMQQMEAQEDSAGGEQPRARRALDRIADLDMGEGAGEAANAQARQALSSLPRVGEQDDREDIPEVDNPSRSGLFRRLRADVPSISGVVDAVPEEPANVISPLESAAIPRISLNADQGDGQSENGRWEGGGYSRVRLGHVNMRSGEEDEGDEQPELVESAEDQQLSEEIEQIYHFRNPLYNTEIWFVAIGSDDEFHDGAKAFIDEHRSELRGAMVVEIESLGVGELCVASEEGKFSKVQTSSRVKRFTRGATEATGIVLGHVALATDSITSVVQKSGLQAMHLLGVEDGLPALKGSADDILENVDEMILEENIEYLMELLKQE